MQKRNRIVFVAPNLSSFINSDIQVLKSTFDVEVMIYQWSKKVLTPALILYQFVRFITSYLRTDAIVVSFGGYWALVPVLFGKIFNIPSVVILHGTDCAAMPSIKYGTLRKSLLKKICHIVYNNAYMLLPVSESLISIKNSYSSNTAEEDQGILRFFPNLQTPVKVIYNGLDQTVWKPESQIERIPNKIVTVISENQLMRKGGDLILQVAPEFEDYDFHTIGMNKPVNLGPLPQNVIFNGKLKPEELKFNYLSATFYLQLSMFEGFGLSLCEAMLCGCIPIGSSVNIIPKIVGNFGYIVESRKTEVLKETLHKAFESPVHDLEAARKHIISNFALSQRSDQLIQTIEELIKNHGCNSSIQKIKLSAQD